MGIAAVTVTSQWSLPVLREGLLGPVTVTAVVLVASLLFHFLQGPLERGITRLRARVGPRILVPAIVALAGLVAGLLTVIVAALVVVETVRRLKLDRRTEIPVVVLACFSVGLGAALTPFGGPLSAVVFARLAGEPFHADAWFLLRNLWIYVIPGIAVVSAASIFFLGGLSAAEAPAERDERESLVSVLVRTVKIYIFVGGRFPLSRSSG
jgi:predicted cation transporter